MLEREGIELPPELLLPDCPSQLMHVLMWFEELSLFRRKAAPIVTMAAIIPQLHPLVWSDLGEWSRQTHQRPTPQEWRLIQQLETRYQNVANKAAVAAAKQKRRA